MIARFFHPKAAWKIHRLRNPQDEIAILYLPYSFVKSLGIQYKTVGLISAASSKNRESGCLKKLAVKKNCNIYK
jgi:hypothetical protein